MAKTRRPRKSIMARVCVAAFSLYLAAVLVNLQMDIAESRQQLDELKLKCEEQRIANKELERVLMLGSDEKYIERVAREKLGFAYPDERVLIDVSGG